MPELRPVDEKERARRRKKLLMMLGGGAIGAAALIPLIKKLRSIDIPSRNAAPDAAAGAGAAPDVDVPSELLGGSLPNATDDIAREFGSEAFKGGVGAAKDMASKSKLLRFLKDYFTNDDGSVSRAGVAGAIGVGNIPSALSGLTKQPFTAGKRGWTGWPWHIADWAGGIPSEVATKLHVRGARPQHIAAILSDAGGEQPIILRNLADAIKAKPLKAGKPSLGRREIAKLTPVQRQQHQSAADMAIINSRRAAVKDLLNVSQRGKGSDPRAILKPGTHKALQRDLGAGARRKALGKSYTGYSKVRGDSARVTGRQVASLLPLGMTAVGIPKLIDALKANSRIGDDL